MGILKNMSAAAKLRNRRNYLVMKMYSHYKKDIWDFLRMKRQYRYKKVLYNMLRIKRKFYNRILYQVYFGVKFFVKRYSYRSNLLFVKKRLKLFYGNLLDTYIGRLGRLVSRQQGDNVNRFFFILERRIDVLLYRALYSTTVRFSKFFIYKRLVYINNNILIKVSSAIVLIGDLIKIFAYPMANLFFQYGYSKRLTFLLYNQRYFFLLFFYFYVVGFIKRNVFVDYIDRDLNIISNKSYKMYLKRKKSRKIFFRSLNTVKFLRLSIRRFIKRYDSKAKLFYKYGYFHYIPGFIAKNHKKSFYSLKHLKNIKKRILDISTKLKNKKIKVLAFLIILLNFVIKAKYLLRINNPKYKQFLTPKQKFTIRKFELLRLKEKIKNLSSGLKNGKSKILRSQSIHNSFNIFYKNTRELNLKKKKYLRLRKGRKISYSKKYFSIRYFFKSVLFLFKLKKMQKKKKYGGIFGVFRKYFGNNRKLFYRYHRIKRRLVRIRRSTDWNNLFWSNFFYRNFYRSKFNKIALKRKKSYYLTILRDAKKYQQKMFIPLLKLISYMVLVQYPGRLKLNNMELNKYLRKKLYILKVKHYGFYKFFSIVILKYLKSLILLKQQRVTVLKKTKKIRKLEFLKFFKFYYLYFFKIFSKFNLVLKKVKKMKLKLINFYRFFKIYKKKLKLKFKKILTENILNSFYIQKYLQIYYKLKSKIVYIKNKKIQKLFFVKIFLIRKRLKKRILKYKKKWFRRLKFFYYKKKKKFIYKIKKINKMVKRLLRIKNKMKKKFIFFFKIIRKFMFVRLKKLVLNLPLKNYVNFFKILSNKFLKKKYKLHMYINLRLTVSYLILKIKKLKKKVRRIYKFIKRSKKLVKRQKRISFQLRKRLNYFYFYLLKLKNKLYKKVLLVLLLKKYRKNLSYYLVRYKNLTNNPTFINSNFVYLFYKLMLVFKVFSRIKKVKTLKKLHYLYDYNVSTLFVMRNRIKLYFNILKPYHYKRIKLSSQKSKKRFIRYFKNKYFRQWSFSKEVLTYFKYGQFKPLAFIGYPAYMEVNYKLHVILVYRPLKLGMVYYPFGVDKMSFYTYFKRKGYF